MPKRKILLGLTGSIACYVSADLVNRLVEKGYEVTCVMTEEATRFVRPLTFEVLSGHAVLTDMFASPQRGGPLHTEVAQTSDLVLIAPATANVIAKLASGIADDLLTCSVLATRAKILICPAMNENMYQHPVTQENIAKLRKLGYRFLGPVKGHLTCKIEGIGHFAPVDAIVREVGKLLG